PAAKFYVPIHHAQLVDIHTRHLIGRRGIEFVVLYIFKLGIEGVKNHTDHRDKSHHAHKEQPAEQQASGPGVVFSHDKKLVRIIDPRSQRLKTSRIVLVVATYNKAVAAYNKKGGASGFDDRPGLDEYFGHQRS